jgi:hypothetical protein
VFFLDGSLIFFIGEKKSGRITAKENGKRTAAPATHDGRALRRE